jgi:hypothetical protein
MPNAFAVATFLLAMSAPSCFAQTVLNVDAAPALAAWTGPEFAAFTEATGIKINLTPSPAGAGILIAPAPAAQIAEHEKLTIPYCPRDTAAIPGTLKDDDGDWTAIALSYLAVAPDGAPPDTAATAALRLLLAHTQAPPPSGTPERLMTLAANPGAIAFPAAPSGGRETIVIPYFIARLKTGAQPGAAAKLIDFLLAKPAQARLSALAWALPARTDVTPADRHFKMITKSLQGVAIYVPNWHQARKILAG